MNKNIAPLIFTAVLISSAAAAFPDDALAKNGRVGMQGQMTDGRVSKITSDRTTINSEREGGRTTSDGTRAQGPVETRQ